VLIVELLDRLLKDIQVVLIPGDIPWLQVITVMIPGHDGIGIPGKDRLPLQRSDSHQYSGDFLITDTPTALSSSVEEVRRQRVL